MLLLCQDVVQLLHQLRNILSSGVCPCSSGHHLLHLHITLAAESDSTSSNVDIKSTHPIVSLPRRVAVAEQSSTDSQSTQDDNNEDGSPWEIRRDPTVNKQPNRYSTSGTCKGVPLLSGKTSDTESSRRDITRLDEAELAELIRRSVSLDGPLQQLPDRLS